MMKMLRCTVLSMLLATAASAQQPTGSLRFQDTVFHFGKIAQSKPVYHSFVFTNTGKRPVRLDDVHASCGCTTPEWSRTDIAPGAKSVIKVGYNAAAEGPFEKTIAVNYGGTAQVLRISGEVWKTPATSAPANASVELLRNKLQPQMQPNE